MNWLLAIALLQTPPAANRMTSAQQHRITESAAENLRQHYPDREAAQKLAAALIESEKSDWPTNPTAFADHLTTQLRNLSRDPHMEVIYSQRPLPQQSNTVQPPTAAYRRLMKETNCNFEKVEMLPHNIGYLKLTFFPDLSVCEPVARKSMAAVNDAQAIIFDLRENRGGFQEMIMFIAAYLFDHPEYMLSPRENTTERNWTRSPVEGNKLADKPVFILTSQITISGAEMFSYDLKMLKRATIVGETTRGATHAGVLHRLDDHFGMFIQEARPINPFGKPDWEGTGIEPDVKTGSADALPTALSLVSAARSQ